MGRGHPANSLTSLLICDIFIAMSHASPIGFVWLSEFPEVVWPSPWGWFED